MLKINADKCNGCKLCEKICPFGAIAVADDGLANIDERCTLCGSCVNMCPQGALAIGRRQASAEELDRYSGVFVWCECEKRQGRKVPKKVVYEILGQARRLADKLDQEVVAVALGDHRLHGLDSLCHYGADRVIRCRHNLLEEYATDSFAHVLSTVIAKEKPSIFLYGATPNGRDLAPRIAARHRLGLTADCTRLDIDDQMQMVQTRPAFGGNIMASIIAPYSRPQTATVRPNVFSITEPDEVRPVNIEDLEVSLSKAIIKTRIVERIEIESETGVNIEEARVIVAAGRGLQDSVNLNVCRELAEDLGGELAGSRAIVEQGWIPHTLQVGQSGTTVGPDLYIAVGISGAIQHVVGMTSSGTVIAINKDPEAPIFKIADLGVVGDAMEIVPRLIHELKHRR
jgi:electron transfer flavoprotein alpha subunit